MRSEILIVMSLIAAFPVRGDAVSDLRAALARFRGRDPLVVSIGMTRSRHSKGRFVNDDFEGSAAARVEEDAAGLRVALARAILDRAATDSAVSKTLAELVPASVVSVVDFAPVLSTMLNGARLIERSSRMVAFALPPAANSDGELGGVTAHEDHLTISVGPDGVPVSARRVRKGSAGALFIRVDTVRTESWDLAVYGDHLIATRTDDSSVVSGPMQNGRAETVWVVRALR